VGVVETDVRRGQQWIRAAALAAVLFATGSAMAQQGDPVATETLVRLQAIRRLGSLSQAIWPDWDISDVPFAVYDTTGPCYLIGHPHPPEGYSRRRLPGRRRTFVHYATDGAMRLDPESGSLAGEPTAFLLASELSRGAVPNAFRAAFRAHLEKACPDRCRPVDLVAGYPLEPRNLALSDIESELLARAVAASDDSLERCVLEFVSVRSLRRIGLRGRSGDYERWLEFVFGLPLYVQDESSRLGGEYLDAGNAGPLSGQLGDAALPAACARRPSDLEWYRRDRFACSGAEVCRVLDRYYPEWKTVVAKSCRDPGDVLWELTRTEIPRASDVLARFDLAGRMVEKEAVIEGAKSEAEKLFDRIVNDPGPIITVNTKLLVSSSVSYDPENVERVDEHRVIYKRIIKVEYSGGTRVHVVGRVVATIVGDDEFDIQQLIMEAPEEYTVTVGGEPLALEPGVHPADRPISVAALGLSIEARSGMIIVGERRVTFVLHR